MPHHQELLDAFAEARRTWDELVGGQPDVLAGSGNLKLEDLETLEVRTEAHRLAMDLFADAIEAEFEKDDQAVAEAARLGAPQPRERERGQQALTDQAIPTSRKRPGALGGE